MNNEWLFASLAVLGLLGVGSTVYKIIVAFTLNEEELRTMISPWPMAVLSLVALGLGNVHFALVLANNVGAGSTPFSASVAIWLVAEVVVEVLLILAGLQLYGGDNQQARDLGEFETESGW